MELDTKRIEDAIVAEVSDKIIGDDQIWNRVKATIDARVDKVWSETVERRIAASIETAVSNGFEREYQKVDSFGRAIGGRTTIAKQLEHIVSGYWTAMVDREGKPTSSNYASVTRAEWLMLQITGDKFSEQMKQHVVNLGGTLKDKLRTELHSTVNSLLSEVFKVRSLDDQKKNDGGWLVNSEKPPA